METKHAEDVLKTLHVGRSLSDYTTGSGRRYRVEVRNHHRVRYVIEVSDGENTVVFTLYPKEALANIKVNEGTAVSVAAGFIKMGRMAVLNRMNKKVLEHDVRKVLLATLGSGTVFEEFFELLMPYIIETYQIRRIFNKEW